MLTTLAARIPLGLGLKTTLALALSLPLVLTLLPPARPRPILPALPEGIERIYVSSGSGRSKLEVLVARPPGQYDGNENANAPVLFVHGGYGSAWCWTRWMTYFAKEEGRIVYAVSLSGHGLSPRPFLFHLRPKSYFVKDLLSVLSYIATQQHQLPPIIVGHSAGGGLSQYLVSQHGAQLREEGKIGGLICVSPFPPTGGWPVYANWLRLDPSVMLRMLLTGNAYTALNTPQRVSRAFFGASHAQSLYSPLSDGTKKDTVPEGFVNQMTKEESIIWPSTMMLPFVNIESVLSNLTFASSTAEHEARQIALVAGTHDALMSPDIMRAMQSVYGCKLEFVEGAGHHLMFDEQWLEGAKAVEGILAGWGI